MLKALPHVRQVAGEPRRLWFFCHEQDLVVFEDENGEICGFQLAYDKYGSERSISWQAGRGFAHYRIEDGESSAFSSKTPILLADGPFPRDRVLVEFLRLADELPERVRDFVVARLREFSGQPP